MGAELEAELGEELEMRSLPELEIQGKVAVFVET